MTGRALLLVQDPELRPRTLGVALVLCLSLTLVWGAMTYILLAKYQSAIEAQRSQNSNLAKTFAEQTLRVFKSLDQATLRVRDAVANQTLTNADLIRFTHETGLTDAILSQLTYVAGDGRLISSNLDPDAKNTGYVDLSERVHIQTHLSGAQPNHILGPQGLYIGQTLVGKVSGARTIQLSRHLLMPDGSSKGMVVASLNPSYLEDNFKEVDLGSQSLIALVGQDGFVRASVQGGQASPIQLAPPLWQQLLAHTTDNPSLISKVEEDPVSGIWAAQAVKDYPIYMVVQTSVQQALVSWFAARDVSVALTILFSLTMLLGAVGYLRGTLKLELSNRELENKVSERTQLLTSALADLKATQSQLIQSEKMVTLGQLLANVAHEINTPIGAIKSSGESISDALEKVLANFPSLVMSLDKTTRQSFAALLVAAQQPVFPLSSREERQNTRVLSLELTNAGVADAQTKADLLTAMRITQEPMRYAVILHHARAKEILGTANQIATIINSAENINTAVDQVGKIVFALKSFSHTDHKQEFQKANLVNGLETVLTIYNNAIKQGVEVTRFYQNVGSVECLESELNQVWTNLIHNALQAMHNSGTLKVSVFAQDGGVAVSIADNGPGIPEDIKVQIFEPFFTTKPIGEGSGLGLDIVKKILDKHHGRIDLHSEIGVGTTFTVWLPLQQPAESGS